MNAADPGAVARRNALAERYLWLVGAVLRESFRRSTVDRDDLYSAGQYALLRACEGQDDPSGSYLAQAIRWAMGREVRRAARRRWCCVGDVLLDAPRRGEDPDDRRRKVLARRTAGRLLRVLSDRQRRVVALVHGLGGPALSYKAAARELGVTPQAVTEVHRRALRKMREAADREVQRR
jgi:RNA polymerase sigma factor (sigma-70 family)